MIFCSKCGKQLPVGTTFCPDCGTAVGATNPQPNPGPVVASGVPVKTDYSLLMYILLTLVTFGIYGFYTIHKLAKDVNQVCAGDGDSVGGLCAYILLSVITCGIYPVFWMYKVQNRLFVNAQRYGVIIADTGSSVLLWYLLGSLLCGIGPLVALHIIFNSANTVGRAYNARIWNR